MKKIFTLIVSLLCVIISFAQIGGLDPTFYSVGYMRLLGLGYDTLFSVSPQYDKKIVVVGDTKHSTDSDITVFRLNTSGSLDNSFSTDGNLVLGGGSNEYARASLIQPDGKILIAGFVVTPAQGPEIENYDVLLYRLNIDGTLDGSFNGGRVVTNIPNSNEIPNAIALQPDGKIVLAGSINNNFGVFRYLSNGEVDTEFKASPSGPSGYVITQVGIGVNEAKDIAIQSDNKILVAGSSTNVDSDFAVVRYNSDGTLDNNFDGVSNSNGIIIFDLGGHDIVSSIKIFEGKILLAGTSINTTADFAIAAFNLDGTVETSFGNTGKTIVDIQSSSIDNLVGISITEENSIILGGESNGNYAAIKLSEFGLYNPVNKSVVNVGATITATAMKSFQNRIYIVGKIFDDFSIAAISNNELALPVQLSSFVAVSKGATVDITWTSASETNTSLFVIERSLDGKHYSSLGQVTASKNSNTTRSYLFTDLKPSLINYYRLKVVDQDGRVSYGRVVVVRSATETSFSISPNPVHASFQVAIADPSVSSLTIYAVSGVPIRVINLPQAKGKRIVPVEAGSLASGTYFIKAGKQSIRFTKL